MESDPEERVPAKQFATTHWSVVLAAGRDSTPDSQAALVRLCETYWYPLYAYVRRQGQQPADAHDLIQEFFARLLEDDFLKSATPDRGRFRSFLLTVLKRFLSKERRAAAAQKRGGGARHLSLNFDDGERRYQFEPVDDWTAEKLYDRRWALTVLDQVLTRLEDEFQSQGKQRVFSELKVYLTPGDDLPSHAEVAERLEMTSDAVKVAVHRLRQRYRDMLRDEVASTVASDNEIRQELDELLSALGSTS